MFGQGYNQNSTYLYERFMLENYTFCDIPNINIVYQYRYLRDLKMCSGMM